METPQEIIEYRPVEAGLAVLREKYAGVIFDVATAKGLDDARKARMEIREPRYECERIRKRLKAPALEYSRRIDTEASRITAELEKLETPIDVVIKREEAAAEARREEKRQAELERVHRLRRLVDEIRGWPLECVGLSAQELRERLKIRERTTLEAFPEEIRQECVEAWEEALGKVREMLRAQEVREAEEARLAAERRAESERQAAEDKRLREERLRLDAERQEAERRAAEERAELDRQHAEHARIERQLAEERARMDLTQARPAVTIRQGLAIPWEDSEGTGTSQPSEPLAPSEPPALSEPPERVEAKRGTTVMRVRFEKLDGHYHCRVFTAPRPEVAFAKNGDLVFHEAEWPDIPLLMRGAEFVEEGDAHAMEAKPGPSQWHQDDSDWP